MSISINRFAFLAVNLEGLKQKLPASAAAVSQGFAEIGEKASDIANDIQALSHRLHSSRLEFLGIAAAASSFCKELSANQGMRSSQTTFLKRSLFVSSVSYKKPSRMR